MKGFFREIRQDRIISGGIVVSFFVILITVIYTLFNLSILPPYLPLYNQLPWGEERLVSTFFIFLPTTFATIVIILNMLLSSMIYSRSQIISRMLGIASCVISFLTFLFIVRTILLIT